MEKLLVIDDSIDFLRDVASLLRSRYDVVTASTGKRGLELLKSENVSAILLDLKMPEMSGFEVLKAVHEDFDPHLPVLIVTDQSEIEAAVKAMQLGAYDYIPKSFSLDLLTAKVVKALERRNLETGLDALKNTQAEQSDQLIFIGDAMKNVHYEITKLARMPFDVLLVGETGAGKDRTAYEIHQRSTRRERPYVPLPLRTLNETLIESELFGHEKGAFSGADRAKTGKLEAANGGTLYIPEIFSLNEETQLKLLHFMQYKTISHVGQDARKPEIALDVRLIMATNETLQDVMGKFHIRQDFYHRIAGVTLRIPPLRERKEDIGPLATYFLKKFSVGTAYRNLEFAPDVIPALTSYHWPGNVRELENVIKNAIAYSDGRVVTLKDFRLVAQSPTGKKRCSECFRTRWESLPQYQIAESEFKHAYFHEALHRSGNNTSQAATIAGLTPQGFRKAMKSLQTASR